jgi:hypothetical protein
MQIFIRSRRKAARPRKGAALFVSLFFVIAVGALALSSIYLSANATLLGNAYEKEDDLKYTSQAALEIGKAELNFNPAALPNSSYVTMMHNATIPTADGSTVPGLTVNLYAGPTGSTSGQFGRFASVVAEARNKNGTGFVRRLELTQESFAKFAYWTNQENSATGTTIVFANGDALWGPVWSNDTITIGTGGASFHDDVGTAAPLVVNAAAATFAVGYEVNQKPIQLPALTSLATLSGLATVSGFNFTPPNTGASTGVLMRIEFVSTDINGAGDSTAANDGFFRVYTAKTGNSAWLRADWPSGSLPAASSVTNCGDWHRVHVSPSTDTALKFFPFASHYHSSSSNTWFDTVVAGGLPGGATAANITKARAEADSVKTSNATFTGVLQHPNVRCYLGGDPHLVSVSRTAAEGFTNAQMHKGGEDTTFTASDHYGSWTLYSNTPPAAVSAVRTWDAKYLFPLYRGYNTNTKGVIYANGTVGISGVVGGDITLYTPYNLVILDDVRYANDPAKGVCVDILGTISGQNTYVADNSINTPQAINSAGTTYRSMDDTPDLNIQAVMMTIATSFTVENYNSGPNNALTCGGSTDGRGCLYLTGGLIQNNRGPVGLTSGEGYIKRYSYDRCAVVNPPPYFPTTGRFMDNRYYELDPVRVNSTTVGKLYKSLTPGG